MVGSLCLSRFSLSSSPSALVFATINTVLSLKFVTSLLTSSCSSLLWLSSAANLYALSLLSPLWGLTVSLRFIHLEPSSFTFVICSLHHPEKPYSFFCILWRYQHSTLPNGCNRGKRSRTKPLVPRGRPSLLQGLLWETLRGEGTG